MKYRGLLLLDALLVVFFSHSIAKSNLESENCVKSTHLAISFANPELQKINCSIVFDREDIELIAVVHGMRNFNPNDLHWKVSSGHIAPKEERATWSNPESGIQNVSITYEIHPNATTACVLQASKTVLIPVALSPQEIQKHIGVYPDLQDPASFDGVSEDSAERIRENLLMFACPQFFYQVDRETFHFRIVQDYQLGDFDLDPRFVPLEYPRYIALHPHLIEKMNLLLDYLHEHGVAVERFKIIYGFRSPQYNEEERQHNGSASLKEKFSLHMYGKAIDFIIDENNDLVMDDLNGDGEISFMDAVFLGKLILRFNETLVLERRDLVGGVGVYYHHDFWERGRFAQSPYVHIDVRGYTRENDTIIRWVGDDTIGIRQMYDPYSLRRKIPDYPF